MVKSIVTMTVLLAATSMAKAAPYECLVTAENPQKPGHYDQILKHTTVDVQDDEKTIVIYDDGKVMASVQKSPGGVLQLATLAKDSLSLSSLAYAKADMVMLVDGTKKWSFFCVKK